MRLSSLLPLILENEGRRAKWRFINRQTGRTLFFFSVSPSLSTLFPLFHSHSVSFPSYISLAPFSFPRLAFRLRENTHSPLHLAKWWSRGYVPALPTTHPLRECHLHKERQRKWEKNGIGYSVGRKNVIHFLRSKSILSREYLFRNLNNWIPLKFIFGANGETSIWE